MWYFIHHSGIHATIAGVLTALTLLSNPGDTESPLEKQEHALTKPVNFLIRPLFALANANIRVESDMTAGLTSSLGLGFILGLFIWKPVGITLFSWVSTKLGISALPAGIKWIQVFGVGLVAGIGFTMSIFIALLSFSDQDFQTQAKSWILASSLLAGLLGYLFLKMLDNKNNHKSN